MIIHKELQLGYKPWLAWYSFKSGPDDQMYDRKARGTQTVDKGAGQTGRQTSVYNTRSSMQRKTSSQSLRRATSPKSIQNGSNSP